MEYINERQSDFLISKLVLCDASEYKKVISKDESSKVVAFENFGYEEVMTMDGYFEYFTETYHLYKRKNINQRKNLLTKK